MGPTLLSKSQLKYYSSLKRKKFRTQHNMFLVEGLRLCEEITSSLYSLDHLLICPAKLSSERATKFVRTCRKQSIPIHEISAPQLRAVSTTVESQGIIGVVKKQQWSIDEIIGRSSAHLVLLAGIRDPGNLGAILRSAAWFGIDSVLLSSDSVDSANPKVVRASMGGLFHVRVLEVISVVATLRRLKESGFRTFLASTTGQTSVADADWSSRSVVILGGETALISDSIRELVTTEIVIPRWGKCDSLNVASAAAIILSHLPGRSGR